MSRLTQEKEMALNALACEVLRLRGQLVVVRATLLCGMNMPAMSVSQRAWASSAVRAQAAPSQEPEAARKAICQTGCAGYAHPWLSEEGQCRRSGRVCDGKAKAQRTPETTAPSWRLALTVATVS
jgi:hypothetical protein